MPWQLAVAIPIMKAAFYPAGKRKETMTFKGISAFKAISWKLKTLFAYFALIDQSFLMADKHLISIGRLIVHNLIRNMYEKITVVDKLQ